LGGYPVGASDRPAEQVAAWQAGYQSSWEDGYLRKSMVADACCALAAGLLAFTIRFDSHVGNRYYLAISVLLPALWLGVVGLAGGYDSRFIGVGPDEFRRVLNAGVFLTAAVAIVSYAAKADLARGYVVLALPPLTVFDLLARFGLRKWLHHQRRDGYCMRKVVVVGHAAVVAELALMLRRETYHGLSVVAACLADRQAGSDLQDSADLGQLADFLGCPVVIGLDAVGESAQRFGADTVAVLASPQMCGAKLRDLAWQLEKTDTDLCVAPALLDVAGPRTTIRPVAGLPLLHVDHPEFTGFRRLLKSAFDRTVAAIGLVVCSPLILAIMAAICLIDGRPVFFSQARVGKDGCVFKLYKFRTMVPDAEAQLDELGSLNETDGFLFKIRRDPRVTRVGAHLRRWSADELPQLFNVLIGNMSLVGPRPALPRETARYPDVYRRRLAVKPGITGLWQIKGRAELSFEESVRLDLRYVENWSLMLDLQIMWKTGSAVARGAGAYLAVPRPMPPSSVCAKGHPKCHRLSADGHGSDPRLSRTNSAVGAWVIQ
jgi:exopolysaccharide biosynthesis polyprenyl glycosylphosphotransferase